MKNFLWVASLLLVGGCSRRQLEVRADPPPTASVVAKKLPPQASASASATESPEPSWSGDPDEPHVEWPEPKHALEPFLTIVPPTIPSGAFATKASKASSYAPPGFDPLHDKPTSSWHMPDGSDVLAFAQDDGVSNFDTFVAHTRAGKLLHGYDMVTAYSVDAAGGHLALAYTRKDSTGAQVYAQEIVDVASGALSAIPRMTCTETLSFAADGRLLGQGYVFDKPLLPHAWMCVFDATGKLLAKIDAGFHNHHAASADYINMASGALVKAPTVVWATREYEPFGGYDLTLLDTSPPHARKIARLETKEQLGDPGHLGLDLATTTMGSTKVRFRTKDMSGAWGAWTDAPLVDAP